MPAQPAHTKLLTTAARQILRPLGLIQKGRSRTWLDDRGWWLGVVEFQPSSWSRGSYLNVGVHWLWNVSDSPAFEFGSRVHLAGTRQFIEFETEEQFWPEALRLATVAAEQIRRYRSAFATVETAATHLKREPGNLLQKLDAGIALTLAGRAKDGLVLFEKFVRYHDKLVLRKAPKSRSSKVREAVEGSARVNRARYERAKALMVLSSDLPAFTAFIEGEIEQTRLAMRMKPLSASPLS